MSPLIFLESYSGLRKGKQTKSIRMEEKRKKKTEWEFEFESWIVEVIYGSAVIVRPYQTKTVMPPCTIHGGGVRDDTYWSMERCSSPC